MADELLWTEAWAEARASNRRRTIEIATIELIHPGIIDEHGALKTIRAVAARKPLMLRLEPEAPVDAGALVEFSPLGFKASLPTRGADAAPTSRISIDNIAGEAWPYIEAAATQQADATLILRNYIKGAPDIVQFGPVFFVVSSVTAANGSIEGECSLDQFGDMKFPPLKYTADRFNNLNAS